VRSTTAIAIGASGAFSEPEALTLIARFSDGDTRIALKVL
jgi:hypothetical protein